MKKILIITFLLLTANSLFSQCLSGDCENGYGRMRYSDGVYEGYWKDAKKQGIGMFFFTNGNYYYGEFQEDNFSGFGSVFLKTGETYSGQWKNGKQNGFGIVKSKTQNVAGTWKEGHMTTNEPINVSPNNPANCDAGNCVNGYGLIRHFEENLADPDDLDQPASVLKKTIEAIFREGKAIFGTISYEYQSYEGQIVEDKPNGYGQKKEIDGTHFFGYFKDGKKNGQGILTNKDGTRIHGVWENNVKKGKSGDEILTEKYIKNKELGRICKELTTYASLTKEERQSLKTNDDKTIIPLKVKFLGIHSVSYMPNDNEGDMISISYENEKGDLNGDLTFAFLQKEIENCNGIIKSNSHEVSVNYNYGESTITIINDPSGHHISILISFKK